MTDAARCPRCRVAFEPFVYDAATTIDLCPSCKGAWFDAGELAQVLHTARDLRDLDDELPAAAPDAPLCPRCAGVCLVTVSYARSSGAPTLERCPYCEGHFAPLSSLAAMRALAAARPMLKPRTESVVSADAPAPAPRQAPVAITEAVAVKLPTVDPDALADTGPTLRQAALSVPLALLIPALVNATGLGRLLLFGVRVSLHELGHASMAWACGSFAIPLPIGLTVGSLERSVTMHSIVLAGAAAGVWAGLRSRVVAPVAACGLYALLSLVCTWGLEEPTQRMLRIFMGCGGELVFGATLMALGLSRMPKRMHWAHFRWVAFALGACCFTSATLFWREAARDWNLIPWDGAYGETGDMARLRDDFGWSELSITARYVKLSWACLAAVVAVQLYAVWRAWQRRALAA